MYEALIQLYNSKEFGNPLTLQESLIQKHSELKKEMDRIIEEIDMVVRAIQYIREKEGLNKED